MRPLILTLLAVAALVTCPPARPQANAKLQRFEFSEKHMGTLFTLTFYAADAATAAKASKAAFARIAELNDMMSDYNANSELMKLCARAGGPAVKVSPELLTVLSRAEEVSRRSEGAFDVTVGPVVRLWRLSRRTRRLPDAEKLKAARALVGWKMVRLDHKAGTVTLEKAGMQLDLGGIAKGYAADEVLRVLARFGITRALVAAGGDITAGDAPPDSEGWSVAIAPVDGEDKNEARHLTLRHASVSTSGDANQYTDIDGVRYSHIVDPRTGLGLLGRMSATVVAPTGMAADSLTKVLAVLGAEQGLKLVEQEKGASGRFVLIDDRGRRTTSRSRSFPALQRR